MAGKKTSKVSKGGRGRPKRKEGKKTGATDLMYHCSKPGIRRLARRGGVKRMSSDLYAEMHKIMHAFLARLVSASVHFTECAKRKTVLPGDVAYALKRMGRPLYGY